MIAALHSIPPFKASRGWVQKFIRLSRIQNSLRLYGKGGDAMPPDHEEQMTKYIGKSKKPRSSKNYPNMKEKYSSQWSGWMSTKGFVNWIHWWYEEVKKVSIGPWCLPMDSCEGHIKIHELNGITIVLLPANTTAVYQPLDQGLISMTKIQYRSLLLREAIDILLRMQKSGNKFKSTTGNGIY
eukprot:IDg2782t1